jgi:hypothetical protein
MKLESDDVVFRFSPTWLGPKEFRLPFDARYLAYVVWLPTLMVILGIRFAISGPVFPGWEVGFSILVTLYLLRYVDHDRPLRSLWRPLWADLTGPRDRDRTYQIEPCAAKVRKDR